MAAKVNYRRLIASMNKMREVPHLFGADVVNKTLGKVVIGAKGVQGLVQRTQKATKQKIMDDLQSMSPQGTPMIIYLATIALKRKGIKPVGITHNDRRVQRQGLREWQSLVKEQARQITAARLRSIGATVAGWLYGLKHLQERAPSVKGRITGAELQPKGSASESFARAASPGALLGGIFNTVEGADVVCRSDIIQAAVDAATADNVVYLKKKFGAGVKDAVYGTNSAATIQD